MKKKKRKLVRKTSKKLITKAGFALKNEYYLEATWILSSIIENKLFAILRSVDDQPGISKLKMLRSLNRIKNLLSKSNHLFLLKHIELRLIDELRTWKNYRNDVFRDMVHTQVSKRRMKKMAEEGIVLLHELNALAKKIKSESKRIPIQNTQSYITANDPEAQD